MKTLPNGTRFVALHYTADEEKRGDWAARARAGVPVREWQREMELLETVYDGEPVYADFSERSHSIAAYGQSSIPLIRGSRYVGGWDCGASLTPAFVLLQITPDPYYQVHAMLEITSPGAEPMSKFAPRVLSALLKIAPGNWAEIEHYGDTTVGQRSGVDGRTAQQEAARHGLNIKPASNIWGLRWDAVNWLLTDWIDHDMPRFLIDPGRCPVLLAGFQGAYKFDDQIKGAVGPERVLKTNPVKNMYSHVHDALQYAAQRMVKLHRTQGRRTDWSPYGQKPFGRFS